MKVMKVSKIAKGPRGKVSVFLGKKSKTKSGITKSDLTKNKNGRIVTKKKSAAGKKAFKYIKGWADALKKARAELGVKGFVAIKKGSALYKKAKELSTA